jgi:hypothetical protein
MMARKNWAVAPLVVAGGVLIALNWAAAAHADPAPPPGPVTAPSDAPLPPIYINAPGDYEDSGSGIGDINLSLF